MTPFAKIGLIAAGGHILFLLYVMFRMSGGGLLTDPVGWVIALWVVGPIAFVAWNGLKAKVWLFVLLPIILMGTYEAYIIGFVSTSSTTALGLFFLALYEWVFIGIVAGIRQMMKA